MRNIFTFCLLVVSFQLAFSQRGIITQPAAIPITQPNPMDPNKDGYITQGFQQPFSGTAPYSGYYVPEFEFKMFGLPKVGIGDISGDNFTGPSCGLSDVVPDLFGYSVYAHKTANNELVFRFRLGKDANSIQSWQVMVDTDGLFGNGVDPNWNSSNPGFELNFSLVTRNNPGVFITNIDGQTGCSNPIKFYPLNSNFQKAVADLETCGDPDIFYDFFINLQDVYALTNVTPTTQLRFAATTSQATGCFLSGSVADISGVDNTNPLYSSVEASFTALTTSQCPTQFNDLCGTCSGFAAGPTPPTINTPTLAGATTVTGTAGPGIYVKILVYDRIGGTDLAPTWSTTPRDSVVVTASSTGQWSASLLTTATQQPDILKAFDKIVGASLFKANGNDCSTADYVVTTTVTVVEPNVAPVAQSQSVTTNEDTAKPITLVATDADAGNVLSYSVVTQPTKGTLSCLTCANPIYTPQANYFGSDSFTFRAYDGALFSNTATVTITINSVNDIPVANNQTLTTAEDTPVSITLTATDVETTSLTYAVATQPTNGTLSGTGASLTYTPNANFNGSDSFTFTANDGTATSPAATISITVTPVPDAPVAQAQSVTTAEDTPKAITLVATDADGNTLTYAIASQPTNGALSLTGNVVTYTPALNFNGSDSFTFTANDGTATSNAATVSITVTPVNDTPVANAQAVTTTEDTPKSITLTATDVDGNQLTYTLLTQPEHGTLTGTAPNLTYTPQANYFGADAFTFKVNDGTVDSNTATVSITVTSVNDAPVAQAQSVTTPEDTQKTITLVATDADGDALTYSTTTPPTNGTVTISGNIATYTPAQNFNGSDSFAFKVNDGTVDSSPATVSITVTAVNDTPIANAQSVTTNEDTATGITLTASDVDNDPLTYTVLTQPTKGVLSGTAPNLTYTPNANANGSDSFTFRVNDGTVNSNTATVSISITPVNDAPVANAQSVTTNEDVSATITLTGTDVEGSALTYSVVTQPANGTLSGTAPNLTYTPNANYFGSDSFTFKVNDGTVDSNIATVSITVTSINDAPVANNQSVTTNEDTAASITLSATDVEGSTLTYTILTQPTKGVLSGTAPNLTYTPNANANGSDSFTFRVNDGDLNSNTATVSISITPVNDTPVANAQSVTTNEDVSATITLTGTDVEGSALSYTVVTQPSNGTLTGTAPNLTYTPAANFNGSDSFTFKVNDGTVDSNTATVSITVTPVNDAPVANNQSVTTNEDTAASITLTGTDVEGSTLTYTVLTQPTKGVLSGTAPNLTYTPNANANGSDSFTFRVNDGDLNSNTATVSISITPVNDTPVANAQSVTTNEDVAALITLTGSDADGNPLTYTVVVAPSNGTLTGQAPALTYTPNANFNGSDSFTFKVNDGIIDSNTATVSITVTPVNDAPVANNQSVTTNEDTATGITLTGSDVDIDGLSYTVLTQPTKGVLSGTAPNLTYTPNANANGSDSFTFRVNDGIVNSNTATVSITITPVNDAPVANSQSVTTNEDTQKSITLTGSDVEGSALTYSILTQPANGTLTGSGTNYTYTPDLNYNGSDSFTFEVSDGVATSNIATVSITVNAVNDAPVAFNRTVVYVPYNSLQTPTSVNFTLNASDVEGSALTFSLIGDQAITGGEITGTAPNLTFSPDVNFTGTASFTFTVSDGLLTSNTATVTILPSQAQLAPVTTNASFTTPEDTNLTLTLPATDANGDDLTYTIVSGPSSGTIVGTPANTLIDIGEQITYKPAANFNGTITFTFTAKDSFANVSNTSIITIVVTPVNDAPIADPQEVTTNEDTAVDFALSGSDVEGSPLTYSVVTQPQHGVLTGSGANLTYTPNANYFGSDSFTFQVNDGSADSQPATVSITVTPVNDQPVANAQSLTTDEDTQLNITLTGSDIDNDPLTYTVVLQPLHGKLTGSAPDLIYTPDLNFNGQDSFQFTVDDGTSTLNKTSSAATVSITVNAVDDVPVAYDAFPFTAEDIPVTLSLSGEDFDSDALTYSSTNPSNGTLSCNNCQNPLYTPNKDFNGTDTFTFTVNDGKNNSNTATITITVAPVYDPPVADAQTVTTDEDTRVNITLTGSDVDGQPLTFTILDQPVFGVLSGTLPNLIYTPNENYNGTDSFRFKVEDGGGYDEAVVTININPVNDAPVASNQTLSTDEDTDLSFDLSAPAAASDVDGDPLTYTIVTQPTHGTLTGTAPNFTYKPNANFNGQDSFTFYANDGLTDSNTATATIIVAPINDRPVANDQAVSTAEDAPLTINLVASDIDGNPLTYALTAPQHGTLSCSDCANPIYTPDPNYNGPDGFTFTVNDGSGTFNDTSDPAAVVSITVTPVNDAPVADAQSVATDEDTALSITLTASDIDDDPLIYSIETQPAHGILTGSGTSYQYTPNADFNGSDSFTFKVNDGTADSNIATVSITVNPVNDPPVADSQSVTTAEDTQITINLVATDIDNDPLTYTLGNPAHGTLSCNDCANPIYTPALNYNGPDSFTFTVNDGTIDSNTATVSITVTPVNDKPIAINQSVTTNEDTPKDITLTGSDVEGTSLTYNIVSGPTEGTLSGTGNTLTYTPNTDNFGQDSFTFTVSDGELTSDPATVSINILSVNDLPVANNDSGTALEDKDAVVTVTANDTDKDGNIDATTVDLDPSTATEDKSLTVTGKGTFSVDNNGVVTFTPVANFNGSVNITYSVKDNQSGLSNEATIAITITPVNDPPTVNVQNSTINEDTQTTICFTVSDIEGDPTTFTSGSSQLGTGTVVPNPGAGAYCFTYTPNPDFNGTETIVIGVCDSNDPNVCNTGTITITVDPVNDAPVVVINNQPVTKLTQTTAEDTTLDFCFTATDTEGDNITIGNISTATGGSLTAGTPANGQLCLSFTPTGNFNGLATFTVELVDDGTPSQTSIITVEVNVTPVNDTPVAVDQSVTVTEDTAKPITLVATDIDNDPLTYIVVIQPQHGTLSGSGTGANLTYTPNANYNGPDSFTFKANDGKTDSNIATVTINVTPVNDPPILNYTSQPVDEDGTLSVCIGIVEPDGDATTYSPNPLNLSGGGTLLYDPLNFCFTFTPAPNFNGNSEWQIEVCDSGNPKLCTTIKISIPVLPVNDPPVAVDDEIEADSYVETEFINIIDNDTDIDEDPLSLTITLITPPSHGTVVEITPGGTIRYQSDLGYIGPDSFEYQVCDDKGACDTGLVTINVGPAPFKIYQGLSPNGDQKNDYWRIDGIEAHPENRVRIFDRYNNLVFDQKNYDNDTKAWTGRSNTGITSGELPESTYYYFVDLLDTKAQYTGFVVLKKN